MNRIGNIYKFNTTKHPRYMQFIACDEFQLNSDVIAVFNYSEEHSMDSEQLTPMLESGIEFYTHTTVYAGVKAGIWTKIGAAEPIDYSSAYFKTGDYNKPPDYNLESGRHADNYNGWHIWRLGDEEPRFVGSDIDHSPIAWLGDVFPPEWIPYRVDNGEFDIAPEYGFRY